MGRRHHHHCEDIDYDSEYVDHNADNCMDRAGGMDRYHDYEYYAQERAYSNQSDDYYDKSHEYEALKKQQEESAAQAACEQYLHHKRLGIDDRIYKSRHTKKPMHMSKAERKEYERLEIERRKAALKQQWKYLFQKKKYAGPWDMGIIDLFLYGREEFVKRYGFVGNVIWLLCTMIFSALFGFMIWWVYFVKSHMHP